MSSLKAGLALILLFLSAVLRPTHAAEKPNVIVILADDLGYGDLGCYGGQKIHTPHLDALARDGTRFTRYYAASGVCSPTRASVLTGRYPLRFGITRHFSDGPEHLVPGVVTLPRLLQQAGYATAHVGKWHLGGLNRKHLADRANSPPGPIQHGFDSYLSMIEEMDPRGVMVRNSTLFRSGAKHLIRTEKPVDLSPKHLTDCEIDEALAVIQRQHAAGKPFYLNLWFDVPHKPYEPAPDVYLTPYKDKAKGDDLLYRSMVAHLDAGVGKIRDKLRELKIAERTLIVFSSDNGPTGPGSPGPYRGGKGTLFEGGIRVPFLVCWPGVVKAGVVTDTFAHATDLLPTICAAASVEVPNNAKLDGRSLWPLLREGKELGDRETTFWQMDPYPNFQKERKEPGPHATEAVQKGQWKLLARNALPLALYDVVADPAEKKNLLSEQPRVAAEMVEALKNWLAEPRRSWK